MSSDAAWAAVYNAQIARMQDISTVALDEQEQLLLDLLLQDEACKQPAKHTRDNAHGQVFQADIGDLEFKRTSKHTGACHRSDSSKNRAATNGEREVDIDSIPWQNHVLPQRHAHHAGEGFDLYDDYTIEYPNDRPDKPPVREREQRGATSRHAEQAGAARHAPHDISHEAPLSFDRGADTERESKTPWIDIMRQHRARVGVAARRER
ncbi:hypothetical protein T484DRAFT_1982089 [Baffinella frigidus]|nr:hypothetical protein T484DRAFT_1982089 [Cryptophyta sp. CCMP2293]